MFGKMRRKKTAAVVPDSGEHRRRPLDSRDSQETPGYRSIAGEGATDRDYLWEEGDPADRRRDPLRKG